MDKTILFDSGCGRLLASNNGSQQHQNAKHQQNHAPNQVDVDPQRSVLVDVGPEVMPPNTTSNNPTSENIMPIGQRISSPIVFKKI
jgi:hypothetical protein